MMKRNNILFVIFLTVLLIAFDSCKSKKEEKPKGPQPTEFEKSMKAKDTLEVKALVDTFFTFTKDGKYEEAADMIYRNDLNESKMPEKLDSKERLNLINMLKALPMVNYEIEYIKFDEYYENEVLCNVIIAEAHDDMPAIKSKMFFKPVSGTDGWVLCLMDTEHGDKGVVKPDKRDSVEKDFAKKEKQEEEAAKNNPKQ